jgi:hypothetical protein
MTLTILQILGVVIFCIFGFQRGWRREAILLTAVILSVLFLSLNGGSALAWILFVGFPRLFQALANREQGGSSISFPSSADPTANLITTLVSFVLIIGIGYIIGQRIMPKPATPVDHFLGLIPAAISGYIVTTYVLARTPIGNLGIFSAPLLNIGISLPSLLFIFVAGVILLAVLLIAGNSKKPAAKEPPKK